MHTMPNGKQMAGTMKNMGKALGKAMGGATVRPPRGVGDDTGANPRPRRPQGPYDWFHKHLSPKY